MAGSYPSLLDGCDVGLVVEDLTSEPGRNKIAVPFPSPQGGGVDAESLGDLLDGELGFALGDFVALNDAFYQFGENGFQILFVELVLDELFGLKCFFYIIIHLVSRDACTPCSSGGIAPVARKRIHRAAVPLRLANANLDIIKEGYKKLKWR